MVSTTRPNPAQCESALVMTNSPASPTGIGIIGMGGFAGAHHQAVLPLEAAGECRLIGTCDPVPSQWAQRQTDWRLTARGVRVFTDYREMLDACRRELGLVTIPTPIPLHAEMHRACVERGLPVYLEKPPTLDPQELQQMIAVDARATRPTTVGFNFIVEEARQRLKQRLLAGEFGALREIAVSGGWPRGPAYYARAPWAGRLTLDGRRVLDSCMGNAMSHLVHDALFWCGRDGLWSWSEAAEVRAELYRANAIESFDTAFVAARTVTGAEVRLGLTHAAFPQLPVEERLRCERATIWFWPGGRDDRLWYRLQWHDGRSETETTPHQKLLKVNLHACLAFLRGERERPLTRLSESQPMVHLHALALVAAGQIHTIAPRWIVPAGNGFLHVNGLPAAIHEFLDSGRFPSEQACPWAGQGGRATAADLARLPAGVERLQQEAARTLR